MPTACRSFAGILIVLSIAACAGSNAKQKAMQASLVALNTARDTFVMWDGQHQKGLVAKAESLEDGKKLLADYRSRRQTVVQGFIVAYSALAAAALEDKTEALIEAAVAARSLYALIKALTEGVVVIDADPSGP